ncbi:MAG: PEGA domain-containing protein [Bryobacteraceae bacterium]
MKTKVSPGRAGVFVDGKYLGPAANFRMARTHTLAEGEHEVRLTEPRYEDLVTKVKIQAGKTTTLSEKMKPLAPATPPFGVLRTISPEKFATVYVNDKFMGHAGEFNNSTQGLKLNPGEYAVKIVPVSGGAGHEEKIRIEADKTTVIRVGK